MMRQYRPEDALSPVSRMFKCPARSNGPATNAGSSTSTGSTGSALRMPGARRASEGDAATLISRDHFHQRTSPPLLRPDSPRPPSAFRLPLFLSDGSGDYDDDDEGDVRRRQQQQQPQRQRRWPPRPSDPAGCCTGIASSVSEMPQRRVSCDGTDGGGGGSSGRSRGRNAAVVAAQHARERARALGARMAARRRWGVVVDALSEQLAGRR